MNFSRQRLVISLYPNRLAAGVFRSGTLLREESIPLDTDDWQSAWSSHLTPYDPALRQILARLRLSPRTPISVLYHSPTAIIRVDEIAGSQAEAVAAAELKLDRQDDLSTIRVAEAAAKSSGGNDRWFVIALSEQDQTANAIFAWVTRCGGTLHDVQPSQAAVLQSAVRSARQASERQATCVIGQEWSAVVSGDRDGIQLARIFELGYRPLVEIFGRCMEPGSTMSDQDAEQAMFRIGIPVKSGTTSEEIRREILPQLSPIIQRLSVEIKQTLRFGLGGSEPPSTLVLEGRGAAIPELPHALTEGVDMHVRADSKPNGGPSNTEVCVFTTDSPEFQFGRSAANPLAMVPAPAAAERGTRSFKAAMMVGCVAGALVLASEYLWINHQSRQLDPAFNALSPDLAAIARDHEQIELATIIAKRAGACSLAIHENSPEQPDIAAILADLSQSADDKTRLTAIDLRLTQGGASVSVQGYTQADNEDQAVRSLGETVAFLENRPHISRLEMGAVSSDNDDESGQSIRRFSMTIHLNPKHTFHEQLAAFAEIQEYGP
ncbi:MAG: hypothetical protein AAGA55_02055 [Planctomycetota bacterium]